MTIIQITEIIKNLADASDEPQYLKALYDVLAGINEALEEEKEFFEKLRDMLDKR